MKIFSRGSAIGFIAARNFYLWLARGDPAHPYHCFWFTPTRKLYDIEDRAKDLDDTQRQALHDREARPIWQSFHSWIQQEYVKELPKSRVRSAMFYMLDRWDTLTSTCKRLCIDEYAYLNDVFGHLPSATAEELEPLLPDNRLAAHPRAPRATTGQRVDRRRAERRKASV